MGNRSSTHKVVFDTDPFAIPSKSIRRQSDYPTSSGGLADIWKCLKIINPATSTEVHMLFPCQSRQLISIGQVAVKNIRITDMRDEEAIQKAKQVC
jgi:hypothetical protein